jgi:nucleotide-binding universal stress UspA family protein
MILRDILAIVTSLSSQQHVISFGQQLAEQNAGRMTAALVNWMPSVVPIDGFVVSPIYAELIEDARKVLDGEKEKLVSSLNRLMPEAAVETYLLEIGAAGIALGPRAGHVDVSIVARPGKTDVTSAHAVLEAAMFDSGRPVVVVPPTWKPATIGKNVLVAWKPTREAVRAVADADEFLLQAQSVSVVTVDAKPSQGYSEQPGADIAAHLAFRGAKTKLVNLDSAGRSEARTILGHARDMGADLIVMGGYGHSRLSEMIFGGVTREMLKSADVPVFMSH